VTWSYDTTLDTDLDRVRFYIADTDTTDQQFSNEEITAMLAIETNVLRCAARFARALATKYARDVSRAIGSLAITAASERAKTMAQMADSLEAKAASSAAVNAVPFVGGRTTAQRDRLDADTGTVKPRFSRGQFDDPGASDGFTRTGGE